jgi:hypothetical protein
MMVHTYIPNTLGVKARGLWVQGKPGLHSKTLPERKKERKRERRRKEERKKEMLLALGPVAIFPIAI